MRVALCQAVGSAGKSGSRLCRASGISLIAALTLGVLSLTQQVNQPMVAVFCFVLAGGLLGFLRWNFHPAVIFQGTAGVMFLGYTLGVLAILLAIAASLVALHMRPYSGKEVIGAYRGLLLVASLFGIVLGAADGIPSIERAMVLLRRLVLPQVLVALHQGGGEDQRG